MNNAIRAGFCNPAMYLAGLIFLGLAAAKHRLQGYRTPTDFGTNDLDASARHVASIVSDWRRVLGDYTNSAGPFAGKHVVELGPGDSLGTGAILAREAASYTAFDAFPLAGMAPRDLYPIALQRSRADVGGRSDWDDAAICAAVNSAIDGQPSDRFRYVVDRSFDAVRMADGRTFDTFLSCAAFEHIDSLSTTVGGLSRIAKPGARFCAIVDFQTHSRWIREADPNNIYRYDPRLYQRFHFPGQPNRYRPDDYRRELSACGWRDFRIVSMIQNTPDYMAWSADHMHPDYRRPEQQMEILVAAILATFAGPEA